MNAQFGIDVFDVALHGVARYDVMIHQELAVAAPGKEGEYLDLAPGSGS